MDFVAFDVETANSDFSSICQLGVVVFSGGKVVTKQTILVNPSCAFDGRNVAIHGIRPQDVAESPPFAEVFTRLFGILRGQVLAHHTAFDRAAVAQAVTKYGLAAPDCRWIDTSMVCRKAWKRFARKYALDMVAGNLGIEFRHHDAGEDAAAAGMILVRAIEETGVPLAKWLELQSDAFSADADPPPAARPQANPNGPLAGKNIVFTGLLSIERATAMQLAAAAGCQVSASVSKKTTILVVGEPDARQKPGQHSGKHQKAEQLISEGAIIRIIHERDFMALIDASKPRPGEM